MGCHPEVCCVPSIYMNSALPFFITTTNATSLQATPLSTLPVGSVTVQRNCNLNTESKFLCQSSIKAILIIELRFTMTFLKFVFVLQIEKWKF